ncbi:MAG: 2-amino-4-hydroxy-6-hydroxymethyldihydropteridine diphosphokinase [Bacteroidales bacterium]|nr:2-amino-4-hydroxy-6-hydroxymethyldihydropteridine diphosphokinase [Bacteroidales bacterium]
MAKKETVFLLLGSNIEPREVYLDKVKELINRDISPIDYMSCVYESEPWGFAAEVAFVNQVVILQTELEPLLLLEKCKGIEQKLGRKQKVMMGYESRIIDIDILYYGDIIFADERLQIPHPQIQYRRFTLMPLVELASDFTHPGLRLNQKQLFEACDDKGKVWKLNNRAVL